MFSFNKLLLGPPLILVLVFFHTDVRAEGRCPDGYFPIGGGNAGWEGCAPMGPESGAGDAEDTPPKWKTRWGAIATGPGIIGASTGMDSQNSAENHAMSDCQAQSGGKPCKISVAYYNQCAALAWGVEGSIWARSPDLKDAEETALSSCKDRTTKCDIYYSACSYAESAQ